jgi:hypothetical protein
MEILDCTSADDILMRFIPRERRLDCLGTSTPPGGWLDVLRCCRRRRVLVVELTRRVLVASLRPSHAD